MRRTGPWPRSHNYVQRKQLMVVRCNGNNNNSYSTSSSSVDSNDLFQTMYQHAPDGTSGTNTSPPTTNTTEDYDDWWQREFVHVDPFIAPDLQTYGKHGSTGIPLTISRWWGRALYNYYNWRRDTWSDLQLFTAVNIAFIMACVAAKDTIVSSLNVIINSSPVVEYIQPPHVGPSGDAGAAAAAAAAGAGVGILSDLYRVSALALGQSFPEQPESAGLQVFYLAVGLLGVASFALVLTLIEQVVLDSFEANVRKGSPVYEQGHYVLLTWGAHNADIDAMAKIMRQLCFAHRCDGGCTIVVMSCNSKLDMEVRFAGIIPEVDRLGTRFVFRQGSPLLPADLRNVSVNTAQAVVIINDRSRAAIDADAQVIRAAVLVDELDFPGFAAPDTRNAHVVVECMTQGAQDLLLYSCSPRIVPCPTAKQDARRLVRMLRFPIISIIGVVTLNWQSASKMYAERLDGLQGLCFRDLLGYFPDGCLVGLLHPARSSAVICPPPDTIIQPGDHVLLQRPTTIPMHGYACRNPPVSLPVDTQGLPFTGAAVGGMPSEGSPAGPATTTPYIKKTLPMFPPQSQQDDMYCVYDSDASIDHEYVCSVTGKAVAWGQNTSDQENIEREGGGEGPGVFVQWNDHGADKPQRVLIVGLADVSFMDHLLNTMGRGRLQLPPGSHITLFNTHPLSSQPLGGFTCMSDIQAGWGGGMGGGKGGVGSSTPGVQMAGGRGDGGGNAAGERGGTEMNNSETSNNESNNEMGNNIEMSNNETNTSSSMDSNVSLLSRDAGAVPGEDDLPFQVTIEHIQGDPRNPLELRRRVQVETYDAAIVLCDRMWVDGDRDDHAGMGGGQETDALRQDSCIMMVQLHLRRLLEARNAVGCHIVCQTMSSDVAVTRFEDISRLPAGVTINRQQHAAEMLVQASLTPMAVRLFDYIGDAFETRGIHPKILTLPGEPLCFWNLQQRALEVGMCVLGWLELPETADSAVRLVFNPEGTDVRSRPRVWWHPGTPQKLWLVVVGRLQVNLALDASKDSSDGDDVIPMQGQWGGGNGGGMGGGTGGMGMPVGEEAQYRSAMFGVLNHSNVAWGKQQQGGTGNEA